MPLSVNRIYIEPPRGEGAESEEIFKRTWFFSGHDLSSLRSILVSGGVSEERSRQLVKSWGARPLAGGVETFPSNVDVLALTKPERKVVYQLLAESSRNAYHRWPFVVPGKDLENWFRGSRLSPSTRSQLSLLVYELNGSLCFSDPEILWDISDRDERERTLKAISRSHASLVYLKVPPESEDPGMKLVRYWGRRGRETAVQPIIRAVAYQPDGGILDLIELLPTLPRKLLNTYPVATTETEGFRRDCFWTTMNFFNEVPDDRFRDVQFTMTHVRKNYQPVGQKLEYGDLVFLVNSGGTVFHAATYLANGLVFTKNGAAAHHPWVIMHLNEMVENYAVEKPVQIVGFGPKDQ